MPRRRRYIPSKRMFELSLRVREGLPFPTLLSIKLILESAMARAQRDAKVILNDYLWMGNHVHMLFVSLFAESCTNFYQEVQKKVTDSMKLFLGVHRLNIWEGDPMLAEILDVEAAIERKAYIYANPARANLVASVSQYQGASTWAAFESISPKVDAVSSRTVPWVRQPTIVKLPSRSLSDKQDKFLYQKLVLAAGKRSHALEVKPNAWMKVFGIKSEEEVAEINRRIKARVAQYEAEAQEKRNREGKKLIGCEALRRQVIMKPHTPKKRERRVFVMSTIKDLRIAYIKMHDEISARCAECYRLWRRGYMAIPWPPGTFRPSPGVFASAISFVT